LIKAFSREQTVRKTIQNDWAFLLLKPNLIIRSCVVFIKRNIKSRMKANSTPHILVAAVFHMDFMVERIQRLPPIIRSTAAYAPPEVVDGKPPIYPYTPIKSSFEDAGSVEDMMLYTELEAAVHAMIQRLEYSFTFNPSLLTIPKRKQQVAEILKEAETYIWRIKEEMRCA